MRKTNIRKRLMCLILVLVMLTGMLPTTALAAKGNAGQGQGSGSQNLSYTQVDGVDANLKHPSTNVTKEDEPLYDDADIVRVSISELRPIVLTAIAFICQIAIDRRRKTESTGYGENLTGGIG